jgi:predicted TIM-barrel fold metal-dependent hydrolase
MIKSNTVLTLPNKAVCWLVALGILLPLATLISTSADAGPRYKIIDMHFHAERPDAEGPPGGKVCAPYRDWAPRDPGKPIDGYMMWFTIQPSCDLVLTAPVDADVLRDRGLAMLKRYNMLALAGGDETTVEDFRSHAPDNILPAIGFGQADDFPSIEALRRLHQTGKLKAISEITAQYAGIAPDDPVLEPYFALAEELDIPVGIHLGPGPPGTAYFATPKYRAAAGDPFKLEPVLIHHPKLRLYAMHAGWPMADAMIAMMYAHPQLYVDLGILDYAYPKKDFYAYLKRLIDAGFEQRIMFGSDNMVWPDAIGVAIKRIESAPFLSAKQKQLIFHDNAARFLRIEG